MGGASAIIKSLSKEKREGLIRSVSDLPEARGGGPEFVVFSYFWTCCMLVRAPSFFARLGLRHAGDFLAARTRSPIFASMSKSMRGGHYAVSTGVSRAARASGTALPPSLLGGDPGRSMDWPTLQLGHQRLCERFRQPLN